MYDILNDPKTDKYWIPIRALKRARHQFKGGMSCENIASSILMQMRKLAEQDDVWYERCPVLQMDEDEQLAIVMSRVDMANPESEDHDDYKRLLRRLVARKSYRVRVSKMTEEEKEEIRRKKNESRRKYLETNPEAIEKGRKYGRERYRKMRDEDPERYLEFLAKQRKYQKDAKATPEGKARYDANSRRGKERKKERMKSDPWFREQELQKRRQYSKRYREKRDGQ